MKKILKEFKDFLEEGMKTIDDAMEERLLLVVEESSAHNEVKFYLEDTKFNTLGVVEIEYLPTADTNYYVTKLKDYGNCLGGYQVTWSEAEHGYGPLLYDVAMEWASKEAAGLTCDRAVVSKSAYKVWLYYLAKRSDVKRFQMDDLKNTLTRTNKDNCLQMIAKQDPLGWTKSPLSKMYRKENSNTIDTFKQRGRMTSQHSSDAMDNAGYGYFDDGDAGF